MSGQFYIGTAAVLGAGVMGAQIAAHLANLGIKVKLYDLATSGANKNTIATSALKNLQKMKPAPFTTAASAQNITVANYEDDLKALKSCQLVIEVIAERLDWKSELFKKISPYIAEQTILASNTSGLSINELAQTLPENLRARFCGVHFFNPPRYMHLVEVIPSRYTDKHLLADLQTFLVSTLGKGVIIAKDTPNFIANRIGVFCMLATMHHAQQYHIDFEIVDALTGPKIGRAKSATFRTMDVVGLDTMAHVIDTMHQQLSEDPWHDHFTKPEWMQHLMQQGALGQKSGRGIYQKRKDGIHVYDIKLKDYRLANGEIDASVQAILKLPQFSEQIQALKQNQHPQAQFLWACFRDLFHYCAVHSSDIADNVRDIDLALRWGFGWKLGPFELWQNADWKKCGAAIQEDLAAGKNMSSTPLPAFVLETGRNGVYTQNGAYAPEKNTYQARSKLAVYKRQLFPDAVLGETHGSNEVVFENAAVCMWHQKDDLAILSFNSKGNTASAAVLEGIQEALARAERDFKALILWQRNGAHFCYGADLKEFMTKVPHASAIEQAVQLFQQTSMKLRNAKIPTIAAPVGMVLGGGCELSIHCTRIVAALETYIGLVETGVGVLPAGGGLKEFALRAHQHEALYGAPLNESIMRYFLQIAKAETSTNAQDAVNRHYLRVSDVIVNNPYEVLYVAKQEALNLFEKNHRPPCKQLIKVAGNNGLALCQSILVNYQEGGFILEYDRHVAEQVAFVLCGGNIEAGTLVDEDYLLKLEREYFVALTQNPKTQQRIQHTLTTGKPLRN